MHCLSISVDTFPWALQTHLVMVEGYFLTSGAGLSPAPQAWVQLLKGEQHDNMISCEGEEPKLVT